MHLEARRELLRESHKHPAVKLLRQIPSIGPIRAALLVALLQTPHRFRVSVNEIGLVCCGTESHITRYAPSDNQK